MPHDLVVRIIEIVILNVSNTNVLMLNDLPVRIIEITN